MFAKSNFVDGVANAKHYLAVGTNELYLDEGPFPWELASSCEPGGSHRLDIATSVWFRAKHKCGLTFRWNFDIEPRSADGSGSYHIDIAGCHSVLSKLNGECATQFKKYLADCSEKVRARANECSDIAAKQHGAASELERAARGKK